MRLISSANIDYDGSGQPNPHRPRVDYYLQWKNSDSSPTNSRPTIAGFKLPNIKNNGQRSRPSVFQRTMQNHYRWIFAGDLVFSRLMRKSSRQKSDRSQTGITRQQLVRHGTHTHTYYCEMRKNAEIAKSESSGVEGEMWSTWTRVRSNVFVPVEGGKIRVVRVLFVTIIQNSATLLQRKTRTFLNFFLLDCIAINMKTIAQRKLHCWGKGNEVTNIWKFI